MCEASISYGTGNSATSGIFFSPNPPQTRVGTQVSDFVHRTRSLISIDTRQQTEWGTLRTYFTVGHTGDGPAAEALYVNRGFIQFAGFTLGLASSFFDFYSSPIVSYTAYPAEDTGDGGWRVAGLHGKLRQRLHGDGVARRPAPAAGGQPGLQRGQHHGRRRRPLRTSRSTTRSSWAPRRPPTRRSSATRTS